MQVREARQLQEKEVTRRNVAAYQIQEAFRRRSSSASAGSAAQLR
jgi:hypothetical protein